MNNKSTCTPEDHKKLQKKYLKKDRYDGNYEAVIICKKCKKKIPKHKGR